jgi:two-component system nitrogen regulation sensor histidine kinase NtrY
VTKIIEDHGGKIDLLDAPEPHSGGSGALVRITLPRAIISENENPEPTAGEQPEATLAK